MTGSHVDLAIRELESVLQNTENAKECNDDLARTPSANASEFTAMADAYVVVAGWIRRRIAALRALPQPERPAELAEAADALELNTSGGPFYIPAYKVIAFYNALRALPPQPSVPAELARRLRDDMERADEETWREDFYDDTDGAFGDGWAKCEKWVRAWLQEHAQLPDTNITSEADPSAASPPPSSEFEAFAQRLREALAAEKAREPVTASGETFSDPGAAIEQRDAAIADLEKEVRKLNKALRSRARQLATAEAKGAREALGRYREWLRGESRLKTTLGNAKQLPKMHAATQANRVLAVSVISRLIADYPDPQPADEPESRQCTRGRGERYCDDRKSVCQEIAETLRTAGKWVPVEWAGPDIITAVGRALEPEAEDAEGDEVPTAGADREWIRAILGATASRDVLPSEWLHPILTELTALRGGGAE